MLKRGHGTIIYTSATAAYRGNSGQHAHTMAMGGRMRLTQSLNAELGPQGIHICHVNMDVRIPLPSPTMTSLSPRPPSPHLPVPSSHLLDLPCPSLRPSRWSLCSSDPVAARQQGLINAPETAGAFMRRRDPDGYQATLDQRKASEEIIEPEDVANTYYHLHMQPRGVWTLDLDIRPWTTPAWFNTS